MTESAAKKAFAARINELCSERDLVERGRQTALARIFGVTPNAARKWLLGIGLPELDIAIRIALWAEVNVEWLLTGRGLKRGDKLPTRAIVVDEILRHGTAAERKALVSYVSYTIEHSEVPVGAEEKARYLAALNTYVSEPGRRKH